MPKVIYGRSDIAKELGVHQTTLSNWFNRYEDIPQPQYTLPDGVMFWSLQGKREWVIWFRRTHLRRPRARAVAQT